MWAVLWRCLQRLARERIVKKTMPAEFGTVRVYVSPNSQLSCWRPGAGPFDARPFDVVRDHLRSSQNAWDIGANLGTSTFSAASVVKAGRIPAVEPDVWLAGLIASSKLLNWDH